MSRFSSSEARRLKILRNRAFEKQLGLCYYCDKPMPSPFRAHLKKTENTNNMRCSAEHIISVQDGGATDIKNVVAAHQQCNNGADQCRDFVR